MSDQQQVSEISFRGEPIPEIYPKSNFQVTDSNTVINSINNMDSESARSLSIDAIHYDSKGISNVRLTNGDIISIETAIALAENNMLNGYTTGATVHGGRTLRTMPDVTGNMNYLHDLPRF